MYKPWPRYPNRRVRVCVSRPGVASGTVLWRFGKRVSSTRACRGVRDANIESHTSGNERSAGALSAHPKQSPNPEARRETMAGGKMDGFSNKRTPDRPRPLETRPTKRTSALRRRGAHARRDRRARGEGESTGRHRGLRAIWNGRGAVSTLSSGKASCQSNENPYFAKWFVVSLWPSPQRNLTTATRGAFCLSLNSPNTACDGTRRAVRFGGCRF